MQSLKKINVLSILSLFLILFAVVFVYYYLNDASSAEYNYKSGDNIDSGSLVGNNIPNFHNFKKSTIHQGFPTTADLELERSEHLENLKLEWQQLEEVGGSLEDREQLALKSIRTLLCSHELFELDAFLDGKGISKGEFALYNKMGVFRDPDFAGVLSKSILAYLTEFGESYKGQTINLGAWFHEASIRISEDDDQQLKEMFENKPNLASKFNFFRESSILNDAPEEQMPKILRSASGSDINQADITRAFEGFDAEKLTSQIMDLIVNQRDDSLRVRMIEEAILYKWGKSNPPKMKQYLKDNVALYEPAQVMQFVGVDVDFVKSLPAGDTRNTLLKWHVETMLHEKTYKSDNGLIDLITDQQLKANILEEVGKK